jgi:hypothetical protein
MDAAGLSRHLAEIRAWWARRATAPDFRAEVCKLLLQTDRDLQATVGAAMDDPAWWREQARLSPDLSATAGPALREEPATAAPDAAESLPQHDWRTGARAQFWTALAALDRPWGAVAAGASAPGSRAARAARPAPAAEPVAWSLRVEPVTADGDRCRVELSWPGELPEGVRVRYSPDLPPFPAGDEIAWDRAQMWGQELPGPMIRRDGRTVLAATVPTGYRVYLPFEVDGERARVGRPVTLGVADPVQRLLADRDGIGAVLTWVWPGGSHAAEVEWASGETTDRHLVTRAQYSADRGFAIADTRAGGRVEVRALTTVGDGTAYSPAAYAAIPPAPAVVRYDLQRRRRLGRAELVLTMTADRDCAEIEAVVVVAVGDFLPLDPADGVVHARLGPLRLAAATADRHVLPWPEIPRRDRPFWIRCFLVAPDPVSVEDPPTDHMRIT